MNDPHAASKQTEEGAGQESDDLEKTNTEEPNWDISKQALGGGILLGLFHVKNSADAANILDNLDPKRLVVNEVYRMAVQDAVRTKRGVGRFLGRKYDSNRLDKAEEALKTIESASKMHLKNKEDLLIVYGLDASKVYGFNTQEIGEVKQLALSIMKEKGLSAREAMQIASGEYMLTRKIDSDVDKDDNIPQKDKRGRKREKKEEWKKIVPELDKQFNAQSEKTATTEKKLRDQVDRVTQLSVSQITGPKPPPKKPGFFSRAINRIFNMKQLTRIKRIANVVVRRKILPAVKRFIGYKRINQLLSSARAKITGVVERFANLGQLAKLNPVNFLKTKIKSALIGAGTKLAARFGLKLTLKSIPGVNIVSTLLSLLGIDETQQVKWLVILVVSVGLFPVFIIFMVIFQISQSSPKAMEYILSNTAHTWPEFEEAFLENSETTSWKDFENNLFSSKDFYLSFENPGSK